MQSVYGPDVIEEELHTIIFMYKADIHKYGNILDQMENYIIQKKDHFPKTISKASSLMARWKINPAITSTNTMKPTTVLPSR